MQIKPVKEGIKRRFAREKKRHYLCFQPDIRKGNQKRSPQMPSKPLNMLAVHQDAP
jgi:hypothetical protein